MSLCVKDEIVCISPLVTLLLLLFNWISSFILEALYVTDLKDLFNDQKSGYFEYAEETTVSS